jgi:flagellar biosynthetic protein FliR
VQIPLDIGVAQVVGFMLVIARLSGLFLIAPVFSSRQIPVRIKAMALMVLGAMMTPIVMGKAPEVPQDVFGLVLAVGMEALIGLAIGFSVAIVFAAVQVGASFIDTSIGFSMANIVDPLNGTQASVLGSFYSLVATLAFLSIRGLDWLLAAFTKSFDVVALGGKADVQRLTDNLFGVFGQIFAIAFQIAAPVLVTLLLVDVVLGIVARVVPQMNVFFVGIPLKIGVGLVAVIITLPVFTGFLEQRVSDVIEGASVLVAKVDTGDGGEGVTGSHG